VDLVLATCPVGKHPENLTVKTDGYPGCKTTSFLVVSSSFPHSEIRRRGGNNKEMTSLDVLYKYSLWYQNNQCNQPR